jgi:hypothetical protein
MWRSTAIDMQNAMGTLYTEGCNAPDIITRLVKLDAGVTGIFNQPDVDKVIPRMQALSNFEFQVLKAVDLEAPEGWLTAPNHDKAVARVKHLVEVEKAVVEQLSCDPQKMSEDIQNIKTRLEKHDNEMQAFRDAQARLTGMLFKCAVDQIETNIQQLIDFKKAIVESVPEEFITDKKVRLRDYIDACHDMMQLKNHMNGELFQADEKPTTEEITAEFDKLMQFMQHVHGTLFKPDQPKTIQEMSDEFDEVMLFVRAIVTEFKGEDWDNLVNIIKDNRKKVSMIQALFPTAAPNDLVQYVTGMRDWNEKVARYIPADCLAPTTIDDRFALWIQNYSNLSEFREKIKAVSPFTKDTSDKVVTTKNAQYLEFIQRLKKLCNVTELSHAWTSVTDIHKALNPDSVNADALRTGAQAILDMKQEIVTTKALVAQYQANAAKAVSDDPSTANELKLEKTKNLTLESNLATAQDQLHSANDRIRILNASTATLQDRLDRAAERVDQLEKEKSTGSAVVQTVDIDGRVSRLLDELQVIIGEIPRRGVGDAVQRISVLLLNCIPDERLQRNFVKQLVLKLQSLVDPQAERLQLMLHALKKESVPSTERRQGEAGDEEH